MTITAAEAIKKQVDSLKQRREKLRHVADDLPKPEIRPLRSWPAHPHHRQGEIDSFNAIPSRYA